MKDNCNDKSHWVLIVLCLVSALFVILACIGGYTVLKKIRTAISTTGINEPIKLYHDDSESKVYEELYFETQNDVIHATSTTGVDEVIIEPAADQVNKQLIIGSYPDKNYDHAATIKPTIYIYSITDPDTRNNEYISIIGISMNKFKITRGVDGKTWIEEGATMGKVISSFLNPDGSLAEKHYNLEIIPDGIIK